MIIIATTTATKIYVDSTLEQRKIAGREEIPVHSRGRLKQTEKEARINCTQLGLTARLEHGHINCFVHEQYRANYYRKKYIPLSLTRKKFLRVYHRDNLSTESEHVTRR